MDERTLDETPWHTRDASDAVAALESDLESGLSSDEARRRLDRFGPNTIRSGEKTPWWKILLHQFTDPLIYVLIVAGLVVLAFQDYVDAAIILTVVLVNAIIGFFQESRARQAIEALSKMSAPEANLVRDGEQVTVPTVETVPGDVVVLTSGGRVPADVRLVRADDLQIDESALTGESGPVRKQSAPTDDEQAVPGDQLSMAFAGTSVTRGRGRGVVVRTGRFSQLGSIAEQTHDVGEVKTPIKEKMDRLGKWIGAGIGVLAAAVITIGLLKGMPLREVVETAVAVAVGAVPEALPVVLTVTLAVGVRRMASRNAIIRSLPAVETLGSTTVVGSDKTGTLTKNEMTVRAIWTGGRRYEVSGAGYGTEGDIALGEDGHDTAPGDQQDEALAMTLLAGLLASEADRIPGADGSAGGDPTELALLVAAAKAGHDLRQTRSDHPQTDIIPFESDLQYMATINKLPDGPCIFMKGSPESVIERCSRQLGPDGDEQELDADAAREAAHRLAQEGLRVLGMAFRYVDRERFDDGDAGSDLVLAGLQGMEDPLRPEAAAAVQATQRAGIRVIMLTGDHADTASAIGRQLGLASDDSEVKEGREIQGLSDAELDEVVREVDVYARVSPEHKLRLVERLKAQNHIVAVTGDGVNDAPALRSAHLGVAMGRSGTDVAREASDMVLADDNFASIISAVEAGRLVFANIRNVTYFLLSTGVAEVMTILFTLLAGWPLPFIAVQVLWINLVTNGVQDVALAFEKGEEGLLDEPPRDPGEGVIHRELVWRLGSVSVFIAVATLSVFWWMLQQDVDMVLVRSVTMTQMVMFQFFHVFNSRSLRRSAFRIPLSANRFLVFSVAAALLAQIAALNLPFLQQLFSTRPIGLQHWIMVVGVGALIILYVEIEKFFLRRRDARRREAAQPG
ncbi:MAG: HAD-IC family P-type ATPase [Candidatus Krumholzibacteriia bacterium]